MGFRLSLKGHDEEIVMEKENITSIKFLSDTADNSNARSTDINVGVDIEGKILSIIGGEGGDDITRKILLWSLISAEELEAYKNATIEVILAGNVVRKYNMPNTFVVDYIEIYDDKTGNGTFYLKLRQKKEKIKDINIEGGYQSKGV
ncbi:hypothetical protein [Pseudostreptobacillus hongkongensis]|uniref:hypothetical protein n=1 Tax=Pseudostreptobacillus hongkongensis TaxID=1162717 RepID=UPI000831B569|nr:hypothetical protein [Pseudostreptobacillus hongkongensis]